MVEAQRQNVQQQQDLIGTYDVLRTPCPPLRGGDGDGGGGGNARVHPSQATV